MKPGSWTSRAETLTHIRRSPAAPARRPSGDLAARLAKDPAADRQDRAVLFGDLDEVARRHEAALRVLPAHEGLDAREPAGLEVDDRLVAEVQLVELDGLLELHRELVAVADGLVHARVEDLEAGLAAGLGHVHRDVGVADHVGRPLDRVARPGDADARRDRRPPGRARWYGARSSRTRRSAIARARRRSGRSSVRIANSSPPRRATTSPSRTRPLIRSVTAIRSSSPAAWPIVSLTTLKSSRSMNRTAETRSRRSALAAITRSRLAWNDAAVGRAGEGVPLGEVLDLPQQHGVAEVERGHAGRLRDDAHDPPLDTRRPARILEHDGADRTRRRRPSARR